MAVTAALTLPGARAQEAEQPQPLRISGEIYSRLEMSDPTLVNRLRLQAEMQVNRSAGFLVEFDDVRTQSSSLDLLDIRQAVLQIKFRPGWTLRAGRQEISLADERLVGADTRWNPSSPAFDGVHLEYRNSRWSAGAFGVLPVTVRCTRPDVGDRQRLVVGLFAATKLHEVSVEPYLLDAVGQSGDRRRTLGLRSAGVWKGGFDSNVEAAFQETLRRWAGHFELGRTWESGKGRPRAWVEYNLATGGSRLFDDLYPAAYSRFGLQDPFPWRDIRYAGVGAEIGRERIRLSGTYRRYQGEGGTDFLGSHWIVGAEFDVTRRIGIAGAFEAYHGTNRHECDLHPAPAAMPFVSFTFRL